MTNRPLACVVLAAGQGTRMKSALPKVLHPVAGRAMLTHVLAVTAELKSAKTVVVVSEGNAPVIEAAKPHTAVVQQKQLGTADAVRAAKPALKDFKGDVLVLYGDTPLVRAEALNEMIQRRDDDNAALVVATFETERPGSYGRIILNTKGQITRIVEAADATEDEKEISLCNGGIMLLSGDKAWPLLDKIENKNAKGEFYLTDIVKLVVDAGEVCACAILDEEDLIGINDRTDLALAETIMQERLRIKAMKEGVTLRDPTTTYLSYDTQFGTDVLVEPGVVFGTGVRVGNDVTIKAFCHIEQSDIEAGAIIGPFARLRPDTIIGEGAHIGNFVEIKKANIGKGSKVNHHSYVGDAEVGKGVNIGAGTITVNYDGYRKHKTTIGDHAFVGSNSSLVAPVTIGAGAFVGAGSVITENVPPETLAVARGRQTNMEEGAKRYREKMQGKKE